MTTLIAHEIRETNIKEPGTYSKAQHKAAQGFDAWEAQWWNEDLPNAEQYTRAEHSAAPGFAAFHARWWNEDLPNAEQYTEAEIEGLE